MPNERLADLQPDDVTVLYRNFQKTDPVNVLHAKLYGHPEARKGLESLVRKHADLFPGHALPEDPNALIEAANKPLRDEIASLRAELDKDRTSVRHSKFQQEIVAAGAEVEDVAKIEQFMVDNEFGPKAVRHAVDAYYNQTAPAVPNDTGLGLTYGAPGSDEAQDPILKQILGANGPDVDLSGLTMQRAEQIWGEMFPAGGISPRRR